MNVLITGGAGYIGNELLFNLSTNPHIDNIIIYDNLSRKNYNLFLDNRLRRDKLTFINAELLDTRRLSLQLKDVSVVYHLAGLPDRSIYGDEDLFLQEQINQWSLTEIVSLIKDRGVKKFVFISTDAVYGHSDEPITINSKLQPESIFAKTKLKGERIVENLSKYMDTYIFRCSGVYGFSPGARFDTLINRLMFEVSFMNRIILYDNSRKVRTYIHVDKVAGLLANLAHPQYKLDPGIYNLADKSLSMSEILSAIRILFPDMEVNWSDRGLPATQRRVQMDHSLTHMIPFAERTFLEELETFRSMFLLSPQILNQ